MPVLFRLLIGSALACMLMPTLTLALALARSLAVTTSLTLVLVLTDNHLGAEVQANDMVNM